MYALLGSALVGWQIIEVEHLRATAVAFVNDEKLGDRMVELLNREGMVDAPLSGLTPEI